MAKKNLQSVADDLATLAATLPTQRPTVEARPAPEPVPALPAPRIVATTPRPKEKPFTLNMRPSLHRQLDRMASDAEMTMKAFILNALKAKGLDVLPEDLVDRRGNRPKKDT